jgi:anti-sigma B factor antagonist
LVIACGAEEAKEDMGIATETLDGGILKVTLSGRLDIQGTEEIDLKFTSHTANQRSVIIDMSAVTFLASLGIRTLLLAAKTIGRRGGKMVLLSPDEHVTGVLETAGIDTLIPIHRSLPDACAAVAG